MAQFPALPLWTDAYLADCSHLSFAEHGAYLRLLMLIWRSPECRIPNDDKWIARKLNCDANAMREYVRPALHEFCTVHGKWVSQGRLRREWEWCRDKRSKNVNAANSRWHKDKDRSKRNAPDGNANGMPPSLTLPTPSTSSLRSDVRGARAKTGSVPDWVPKDAWEGFVKMRKSLRNAPLTERAVRGLVRDLEKLRDEGHDPAEILDQSTKNAWRGLFPIRTNGHDRNGFGKQERYLRGAAAAAEEFGKG